MARQQGQSGARNRGPREASEFDERVLELARVSRVTKGGKRMRFRATIVAGNHKGRVGFGTAKGADVALAVGKASRQAKRHMLTVPMINETIPHVVSRKFAAAHVLMKPAPRGTGIKAGGAMRVVLELAGVPNVVGKQLGSANKINNVKTVMQALALLRMRPAPRPAVASHDSPAPATHSL